MKYSIVALSAFFAGMGSAIAGGGAGLVLTPLMLLLGFAPQTALASAKAAGLGLNVGALGKFTKADGAIHWRWAAVLSAMAVVASLIGTRLLFILDAEVLRTIVGVITVGIVPVLLIQRNTGLENVAVSRRRQLFGGGLYFLIMIAQAGLGSGLGSLLMFVLMGLMGFDALRANATKRVSGLVLVVTSFVIFAFAGLMDWWLALSLGSGMLLGGYIGAQLAIKHGSGLVKRALLGVTVVMGISVLIT